MEPGSSEIPGGNCFIAARILIYKMQYIMQGGMRWEYESAQGVIIIRLFHWKWVLVIDVSPMKDIRLFDSGKCVVMESGVQNREVYNFVGEKGYPFPGGTCPTVGAAGYTLGGGWGYSSRFLGLGCDSLKAAEIVNYEGKVLTADETCNPDLFWALRGAGGGILVLLPL